MNKIYKIVWNSFKKQWIVTSELAKRGKTKSTKAVVLATLSTLPILSLASECTKTNNQIVINSMSDSCDSSESVIDNPNTDTSANNSPVIVSKGFVIFNNSNGVELSSHGQNHALIIGTPNSQETGGSVTINEDLSIYTDATVTLNHNKWDTQTSGIVIGDDSKLTVKGDLFIEHQDNIDYWSPTHTSGYKSGAAMSIWNQTPKRSKVEIDGSTIIIALDGDGIRNGEETDPSVKGGRLHFNEDVNITAKFFGLKNNDGETIFENGLTIKALEGTAIVQLGMDAIFRAEHFIDLEGTNSSSNTLNIHGGKFTANGNAFISAEGKGDPGNNKLLSAAIFQTNGTTNFGDHLTAITNNDQLGTVDNSLGDVIRIQGGKLKLGDITDLEATQIGDGLSVEGGEVTLGKDTTTININNHNNNAIKITGGTITAEDYSSLTINKFNGTAIEGKALNIMGGKISLYNSKIKSDNGKAIDLSGGTFINRGNLEFSSATDEAIIHGTAGINEKATFENGGNLTPTSSTSLKYLIANDNTGTLEVINDRDGKLELVRPNSAVLANTSAGIIDATNNGTLIGKTDIRDGTINLKNTNLWKISADSTLSKLTNTGTIQFLHTPTHGLTDYYTLRVAGDYEGGVNSIIKMHTVWNAPGDASGAGSSSDQLFIGGTATGSTTIIPVSTDSDRLNIIDGSIQQINEILNTIPVVIVNSGSNQMNFTGTANTDSASEAQLYKRVGQNGSDEYYWTIDAVNPPSPPPPPPPPPPSKKTIYAESVAGYVLMPQVNLEQGFTSLATLRERRGDMTCDDCSADGKRHTWGRIIGKHHKQNGKERLNLDTDIYGLQIGHDFWTKHTKNNGMNMLGGYLSYTRANTDFSDMYHAKNGIIIDDKKTGEGKSDSISLGITNTFYAGNGSYLDLVGQLSYLHNKYTARSGNNPDSQDGWGVAISAEAGRAWPLGKSANWTVTPQAQLIYQYLDLDNFNDGIRHVDQNNQDALRGRVGIMLAYSNADKGGQSASVYTIGNIWHDFIKPDHVNIGRDSVREKHNQTWGEIGVGVQIPVAKQSQLYGDVRYEHNFGSTKYQSFSGNIGLKINW